MGLRTASVRRPRADVMAPALTDSSVQGQKFSDIPPKSHLEPASPVNSFETNASTTPRRNNGVVGKNCCSPNTCCCSDDGVDEEGAVLKCRGPKTMNLMADEKMGIQKKDDDLTTTKAQQQQNDAGADSMCVDDIMQQVFTSIGGANSDQLNTSSGDLTEVFANIDKDLLDVDSMINISMDDQPDVVEAAHKLKQHQAEEQLAELERKHIREERRLDFLKRRCYKLQSRLMGQHVSGEIVGVFEQVHRLIKKPPKDITDTVYPFGQTFEPKEEYTPLTASAAKVLARKLETAKNLQANNAARQKNCPKYFGSGSIETSLFRNNNSGQVTIPQWSTEHKLELKKVSEQLQTQIHVVRESLDSEATESSSGGESCDESQVYNNPHQQYLSIQKRALWKYLVDRAAIAARWTWLQSQISDLEYRIRQHTDIHRQIRAAKGPVQLADIQPPKPVQNQSEIAGHHDYGQTPVENRTASSALNGYLGQLPGASVSAKGNESDFCQSCARTRPLVSIKKRRLLQVSNLHVISKKAARPSSVRCNCTIPSPPCALCTGRVDPTQPRSTPDTLGRAEKVALLDPGYHPVLSMPEDTAQSSHLEAVMKMYEWQQRSLKMKTIKVLHKADRLESTRPYEHRNKKLEHRKRYKRLKSSTVTALSEKIKKKLRNRKVGRPSKNNKRQFGGSVNASDLIDNAGSEDAEVEATIGRGSHLVGISSAAQTRPTSLDSPVGSPLLHMQSISGYKQNHRISRIDSYDIDNIVIPYSVASTTRVEKLQYKEILTPKWRIVEDEMVIKSEVKNNGSVGSFLEDSDVEDVTDEAVVARHDRCEHDEKKRFLSYVKFPLGYGNRQRSHKRQDSLAESSGANTPDPASPHPDGQPTVKGGPSGIEGTIAGSGVSLGSPPPTPNPIEDVLPSIALARRRTVSQSRFREVREDAFTVDYIEQPPYESRTFPLAEDEFDRMVQEMPDAHRGVKTNYSAQDTGADISVKSEDPHDSGDSESTESAIGEDAMMDDDEEEHFMEDEEDEEDPNDPEWTDAEKTGNRERHHRR